MFPSPTGVNHYEYEFSECYKLTRKCFRPQQGLTIMNKKVLDQASMACRYGFRPQQGLTIMNDKIRNEFKELTGF